MDKLPVLFEPQGPHLRNRGDSGGKTEKPAEGALSPPPSLHGYSRQPQTFIHLPGRVTCLSQTCHPPVRVWQRRWGADSVVGRLDWKGREGQARAAPSSHTFLNRTLLAFAEIRGPSTRLSSGTRRSFGTQAPRLCDNQNAPISKPRLH